MKNRIIVGLYIRVSTQEQADEGYSIGEQKTRLEKYADAHGWIINKIYSDPGYSGGSLDRPGVQELIVDVEKGKLDKVLVYKLDRLSRSQKDTLYLIEDIFQGNQTDFVSMSENFDTGTPLGMAMIGILSVFAQLERAQIQERMTMGRTARAKEGKWRGGGFVPIGYDYNPNTNLLEINKFEKMQIEELAKRFLNNEKLGVIANDFKEKGYRHKYGAWIPKTMRSVLKNKTYAGYIATGQSWTEAEHQPIFTEKYFDLIQKKIKEHSANTEKYKDISHKSILGGFLFCAECGARYYRAYTKTYTYYKCYSKSGKAHMIKNIKCKSPSFRVEILDDIIIGEIKKLKAEPTTIDFLIDEANKTNISQDKNEAIKKEVSKIDNQINKLIDLYSLGSLTYDKIDMKISDLTDQKNLLLNDIIDDDIEVSKITKDETIDILDNINDIFKTGTLEEKREIIGSLIDRIDIGIDEIKIHWKFI